MNWDRPKQSIRSDGWGVIVDLCRESNWTVVDIESYKPEYTLMLIEVDSDVLALHEAHVGLKRQLIGESESCTDATNPIKPDESLKIGDLGRLCQVCDWRCR